ncbi:hypothetical protein DRO91_05570 [Candidatus Heimdallarchaeota archaeon]|nr:MAG: hypothetical protein DRO91_05570 [Candidatus Heimdallarchaeota archaeon]
MTNIIIHNNDCWICGEIKHNMTTHHTLPRHLKPKKNVLVQVCEDCHKKITSQDITGLILFASKIEKLLRSSHNGLHKLNQMLQELDVKL